MTTESKQLTPSRGTGVLLGAAAVSSVPTLLLVVAGAVVSGAPAAYGALVGGLLVLTVSAFGLFSVHVVSNLVPSAALMFAMLTYTLQVVVMALAFVALQSSGLLDDGLDRTWLAAAVIAAVLCWVVAQIVLSTKQRIPAYDLPGEVTDREPEAGAR